MTGSVRILLVEDNEADAWLTTEALEASAFDVSSAVVTDGAAALAYLRREAPYQDVQPPDLVLLDLNLPKLDGRQVLAAVNADATLRGIPFLILTSSDAGEDVQSSYALGANSYIVKPVGLDHFQTMMRGLEEFWFRIARLPRCPAM
jgi:CheY-like chemotaxis protein